MKLWELVGKYNPEKDEAPLIIKLCDAHENDEWICTLSSYSSCYQSFYLDAEVKKWCCSFDLLNNALQLKVSISGGGENL